MYLHFSMAAVALPHCCRRPQPPEPVGRGAACAPHAHTAAGGIQRRAGSLHAATPNPRLVSQGSGERQCGCCAGPMGTLPTAGTCWPTSSCLPAYQSACPCCGSDALPDAAPAISPPSNQADRPGSQRPGVEPRLPRALAACHSRSGGSGVWTRHLVACLQARRLASNLGSMAGCCPGDRGSGAGAQP